MIEKSLANLCFCLFSFLELKGPVGQMIQSDNRGLLAVEKNKVNNQLTIFYEVVRKFKYVSELDGSFIPALEANQINRFKLSYNKGILKWLI